MLYYSLVVCCSLHPPTVLTWYFTQRLRWHIPLILWVTSHETLHSSYNFSAYNEFSYPYFILIKRRQVGPRNGAIKLCWLTLYINLQLFFFCTLYNIFFFFLSFFPWFCLGIMSIWILLLFAHSPFIYHCKLLFHCFLPLLPFSFMSSSYQNFQI